MGLNRFSRKSPLLFQCTGVSGEGSLPPRSESRVPTCITSLVPGGGDNSAPCYAPLTRVLECRGVEFWLALPLTTLSLLVAVREG